MRRGISLVPEKRELFADMTVQEDLELGWFSRRRAGESRAALANTMEEVFALFPRLKERLPQLAGTMSGGERQMLAVEPRADGKPKLLLLDGKSLGLAPLITRDIPSPPFRGCARLGSRCCWSSKMPALRCRRLTGYVLETGDLSLEGKAEDLLHDERVIATYLGKR